MTITRCPLCRARLSDDNICPRCGADLSLPRAAQNLAAQHIQQALTSLAAGERHNATAHADRALHLHRTPLAEAMAEWLHAPAPRAQAAPNVSTLQHYWHKFTTGPN